MWLHQKVQWIPTLTLFLFLYPLGWLLSHVIYIFYEDITSNNLSIIGTIITYVLFLIILPSWARVRWKTNNVWLDIGLDFKNKIRGLKIFFNGLIWSLCMLGAFFLFILFCGWIDHFDYVELNSLIDVFFLIFGIVFAEELIFRGWLMEEMVFLFGLKRGIILQSAIFSLAHYRTDISLIALIPFLSALFLFGLVLTIRRTIDKGSLLGCIGLHGGLVGIWYLVDSGLVAFSPGTPFYFLGPSIEMVNPLAGISGITVLIIIVLFQRRLFSRTGRFLASTVNASSKDEIP
tara:strand:- start:2858 stop:3727 length:870 start_codon:yes stop_codon:yes gene_type:complete